GQHGHFPCKQVGLTDLKGLKIRKLYFVEGELSKHDLQRLAGELLSDPVAETYRWRSNNGVEQERGRARTIEVGLRPGVTDPDAEQIVRSAKLIGIEDVKRAATGQRYVLDSRSLFGPDDLDTLARRLLANPVIQRYALGELDPSFPHAVQASSQVAVITLRDLDLKQLLELSSARRAALDLAEMQAVQAHYRRKGRDPTDVELETIAQTWSEHCVHKTFRARISIQDTSMPHTIDGLMSTYIRAATEAINAPWVRSAFVDNAGIIDFDDEFELSFKVETHNHPSAIEPFGGANTGVGGVIRDILGVSAKPIAITDVLCFGPQDIELQNLPEGVLHPRRIRSGVVAGIQDYGNKIGIPTVNGAVLYGAGYTANPLVFCGCVGISPKGRHPRRPRPGDRVVVLGGRTGRDGLRGATFSSMEIDAQTEQVAGVSVQIGDPITEKGLVEVVTRARDLGLYHAITDCGAGGLSSAVGEMAREIGAEVDLARVRLKYPGLAPWEIWLSEAQERMVLAVPEQSEASLQELCNAFDVELTDLGAFTDTGRLVVLYDDRLVLDLSNSFLFGGMPLPSLKARLPGVEAIESSSVSRRLPADDFSGIVLKLLAHPNIASKADVVRVYDHEVQGATVVKPLTGAEDDGPSDACVLKPLGTKGLRGIVISNGINPDYGKHDPYRMAVSAVDEAVRNAVAVGADPTRIALLDNFSWGDPMRAETLGELAEAARGCYEAALHHRAPFISGKDSLNNEYQGADGHRHSIPPTLLISAIGIIEDVTRAVTMDLKEPGDILYLLGETRPEFGGSHFNRVFDQTFSDAPPGGGAGGAVPSLPSHAPALYQALNRAMRAGLVRACHDLSEGGLAVAAAEMSIAGRLGMELTLTTGDLTTLLFSESNGRFLVEVRPSERAAFESRFQGSLAEQWREIGEITSTSRLSIRANKRNLLTLPVAELVAAWNRHPGVH
ncbi:MAG: phosphoribosylformylglycinamidine synthase subunit PurL, partial [Anaerolineales bacterium]